MCWPGSVVRLPPGQATSRSTRSRPRSRARSATQGPALAARLPVLRPAVCDHLIDACAKKNGAIAAAVFVPGVDLPLLTMNQIRLVLRIAIAYGEELDQNRAVEIVGVVGAGYGFRMLAREALDLIPVAGWAVKGAVAYSGTRAIGAAAVRLCEARTRKSAAQERPSGRGPTLTVNRLEVVAWRWPATKKQSSCS